jgi:outer membrane immunogenic protein
MRKAPRHFFPSTGHRPCVSMACLLLALTSPAIARAADLGVAPMYKAPPAPPAPVATWAGSYFGVSGGGAWGSAVVRDDATGADRTPHIDLGGGLIGVTSGINAQVGNVVLGVEGDTSISGKKGSATAFPLNATFSNEVREHWLSTFRGRLGYAQNNWMVYATAGGALADLESTIVGPGGALSDRHWHWGWTAGGGVEVQLSQDWSAKVEYLYVGLQDKSYFNPAPSLLFPSQRVHADDHIVRVGVNYKLPWSALDTFFRR